MNWWIWTKPFRSFQLIPNRKRTKNFEMFFASQCVNADVLKLRDIQPSKIVCIKASGGTCPHIVCTLQFAHCTRRRFYCVLVLAKRVMLINITETIFAHLDYDWANQRGENKDTVLSSQSRNTKYKCVNPICLLRFFLSVLFSFNHCAKALESIATFSFVLEKNWNRQQQEKGIRNTHVLFTNTAQWYTLLTKQCMNRHIGMAVLWNIVPPMRR